jgi:hypothetical protein
MFDRSPGLLHNRSPEEEKIGFFTTLFAARTDVFARRWENPATGASGWMPATLGAWRKGGPRLSARILATSRRHPARHAAPSPGTRRPSPI